jgi:nucleoside-diphosphate-sugar epimerase
VRQTTYGERFYQRVFAGKSAQCLGDPTLPHSLAYAPDVAKALVTLADHDEALGQIWHLPAAPAESMDEITRRLGTALHRQIQVSRVPRFALHAMGLFAPLLREVAEMAYQWDAPYVLDDSKFRAAFGGLPTPMEHVIQETATWALATYGGTQVVRAA